MNGFFSRSAFDHRTGRRIVFLSTLLLAISQATPARASRILSASGSRLESEWSSFLAGGSKLWASVHAPPITLGVRVAMFQALTGSNPNANPFVQYLVWRHNLDPARFDFWHPRMGPIIEHLPPPTVSPQTLTNPGTPGDTPPPGTTGGTPPPLPPPIHNQVPEPSTLIVAVTLFLAGAGWRRKRLDGPAASADRAAI